MSFSTAFQSLRAPARSIASAQGLRRPAASLASRASSTSSSKAPVPIPHVPHGHLDEGVAGPSRCFCTSHKLAKASDLRLEELHYHDSLDTCRYAPEPYWQPAKPSTPNFRSEQHTRLATRPPQYEIADPASFRSLLDTNSQRADTDPPPNDFFTSSAPQHTRHSDIAVAESTTHQQPDHAPAAATTVSYIDSLDPTRRDALDNRVRLLIRSGEHSMTALAAEYGELAPKELEQVCCHIMSNCIKEKHDARILWDLYRSWTPPTPSAIAAVPSGPVRSTLRRMQGDTLYRCCICLHTAGMTRQAAIAIRDARLKPSQARYLLERLVYDLTMPPSPIPSTKRQSTMLEQGNSDPAIKHDPDTFAAARLAVSEISDTMMNLMADRVSFKQKVVDRTLKSLCLTRARSRMVRLLRAAQRRAQLDLLADNRKNLEDGGGEMRPAPAFSPLRRMEVEKVPQVVSTRVMESSIRLLCLLDSRGARTAYDLLSALDPTQRTAGMYDALMTVYGNVSTDTANKEGVGCMAIDEQLWHDICTFPHLAGPSLHTISARIICHTRRRKFGLIQSDLAFLRSQNLGTIHELTENAKLSIIRCSIESGSLLPGFRYASILLRHPSTDAEFQAKVVTTLLKAGQHIHATPKTCSDSVPSRAQLLKRFIRHFSHLHNRFPALRTDLATLELFLQLLDRHQLWIKTETLWNMLRVVGQHFGKQDSRLVDVICAFEKIFENRGEVSSAQELRRLINKLQHSQHVT